MQQMVSFVNTFVVNKLLDGMLIRTSCVSV